MNDNIQAKLEEIKYKKRLYSQETPNYFDPPAVIEIGHTKWYKQVDSPINYDEKRQLFISNLKNGKHAYFSYLEKNTNFSLAPKQKHFDVQNNQYINIDFEGKSDSNVGLLLIINFYKGKTKIQSETIEINDKRKLQIPSKTDNLRVALRIRGNGEFNIRHISINDSFLWQNEESDKPFYLIQNTNWYLPKKQGITYNQDLRTFNINLEEGKHLYIPYNEANDNFNNKPSSPLNITNKTMNVLFEGECSSSLSTILFIIFYNDDGEKIHVEQVHLNSQTLFEVPDTSSYYRIAIRVAGNGNLRLFAIAISGQGYWVNQELQNSSGKVLKSTFTYDLNQSNLFGVDTRKNRLIYHNSQQLFESRLVGKQYIYLTCFDEQELTEPPQKSVIEPKRNHYYEIMPIASIYGGLNLTLTVITYRFNKKLDVYQFPFNKISLIQFNENVTSIKCLVRVNGKGYFNDAKLLINEKKVEVYNRVDLSLDKKDWFQSGKNLTISNEDDLLKVTSNTAVDKRIYFSYKERNNSFSLSPTFNIIPINSDSVYEFDIKAKYEGIQALPMLVQYAGDKKTEVIQLQLNKKNIISMQPDTTDIRIAFRFTGQGYCEIEQFTILEKESIKNNSKVNWIDSNEIIELGLSKPKPQKELKMAVIFDEFTMAAYKEECNLITFTPENWLEKLSVNKPDLLMVESAWQGNGGSWNKKVGYYGEENIKPLTNLIEWCNENNIPTVFWNKEDPVHFNRFIETAIKFDYIFTTDENMVEEYKKRSGHDDVYALPFAAQPVINNPIKIVDKRENKACFAGSYYRHHEERAKDMDRVLDSAAKYGLEIYDRNYEKNLQGLMPNHRFPERFHPYIKGSLKYYEIDKAYKGYKVMINVNTVKHSPTMFSRRVFEGLACGTPIVSTYAQGIGNFFGDLVYISEDKEEIERAFNTLLNDEEAYREKAMLGIREVLSKHTYAHRLNYIANIIGLKVTHDLPKVTVVAFASTKEEFDQIVEQFNRQTYENKELHIVIELFDGYLDYYKVYNDDDIKTFVGNHMKHYKNIKEWIDTPYVTYFSNKDYYGKNYLLDLMLCTTFTDSEFIGKNAYFEMKKGGTLTTHNEDSEYEFVYSLCPNRTVIKTDTFSKDTLSDILGIFKRNGELSSYLKFGKRFYSNDKYNYLFNVYSHVNNVENNVKNQIEI